MVERGKNIKNSTERNEEEERIIKKMRMDIVKWQRCPVKEKRKRNGWLMNC
jgi:hypothetical protein